MRIGTWNLEGRWNPNQVELLLAQDCDVWLLTEVHEDALMTGFESPDLPPTAGSARRLL
ncbi:MAG: hypothetical protein WAL91_06375 [Propionicimonas sp.]